MNAFEAVDGFLKAGFRIGLEDVLCEGCLIGRLGVMLSDVAKIVPRLVRSVTEDDGGICNTYDGILTFDGVWYRFRCHVFIDGSGQRFLSDIAEFRAIEWQARLAMPVA